MSKVGVALAGGGARGAFQVGVIRAYIEQGGQVSVLAGTSIGAINGAVLLSAPSLVEGVERLERLWRSGAGPCLSVARLLCAMARFVDRIRRMLPDEVLTWMDDGLYATEDLEKELRTVVDPGRLSHGPLPFYVSVYRSEGAAADFLRWTLAELGVSNTRDSHFLSLKGRSPEQIWQLLLASRGDSDPVPESRWFGGRGVGRTTHKPRQHADRSVGRGRMRCGNRVPPEPRYPLDEGQLPLAHRNRGRTQPAVGREFSGT